MTCPPKDGGTALLVEAPADEEDRLQQQMDDWQWLTAPDDWLEGGALPEDSNVRAVLVFARPKEENHAYRLCQKATQDPQTRGAPVLVVINRYQMMLGHDVKRLPHGGHIMKPLEPDKLRDAVNALAPASPEH